MDTDDTTHWRWPDELDALTAAPGNHHLELENERVRVLMTHVPVGTTTPVHTHRWPGVEYVLSATDFVRYNGDGKAVFDSRAPGAGLAAGEIRWAPPFPPHALHNVGDAELRVLMIEVKDA